MHSRLTRLAERARPRLLLLRELPRVSATLTTILVVVAIGTALLSATTTLATAKLVASVPRAVRDGLGSAAGRTLTIALVVVAAVFVVNMALGTAQNVLQDVLGRRVDGRLRVRVMEASLRPPGIAHLEDPAVADRIRDAQGIGTQLYTPAGAVSGLAQIFNMWLNIAASAVLAVVHFHWWLAVACLAAAFITRTYGARVFLRSMEVMSGQTQAMRRSDYDRELALAPEAAKETRIFGLGDWILDRFRAHWTTAMSSVWRERRSGNRRMWPVFFALMGVLIGGYGLVGAAGLRGRIGLESVTVLINAIFGAVMVNISDFDLNAQFGSQAVPAAIDVERAAARVSLAPGNRAPSPGSPVREIRFERVAFRYPGRTEDVFSALNLIIPAGRSLAVVGANGAGKTTLVKLLARLYDPTAGRITVDGTDLRDVDAVTWQRRVAAIFQDFVRYELAVSDNIGFGAIERSGDRHLLADAALKADVLDVVEALPNGWDTVLSREFAEGADLSGGQWQRVALARALLAASAGAGVLVLDEPTANLDVRAEVELFERLLAITRGERAVTTILISHRFSTVRHADRICVLADGRIAEEGTHDELVAAGGRYARMFELQASRFRERPEGELGR